MKSRFAEIYIWLYFGTTKPKIAVAY